MHVVTHSQLHTFSEWSEIGNKTGPIAIAPPVARISNSIKPESATKIFTQYVSLHHNNEHTE